MYLPVLITYLVDLSKSKKLLSEKLRDLRDTMPRHWSLFWLSQCYLQGTMPCQWSSSDFLSWVLRIWESLFYSQAFFALHSFLLVSRPPWGRKFNLNISRASRWYFRNIAPAQLFVWITTIHNKNRLVISI